MIKIIIIKLKKFKKNFYIILNRVVKERGGRRRNDHDEIDRVERFETGTNDAGVQPRVDGVREWE